MNVLFIHQNFPGQFRHLALELAKDARHKVVAIGTKSCPGLPGVRTLLYEPHRRQSRETHHYVRTFEAGVLHGQAVLRLLVQLRQKGFTPDVVFAHPGWGETLYLKEVFPRCKLVHFCEFYYHPTGADCGFDAEFPQTLDDQARIRSRNALHLLNMEQCDVGVAPTAWQRKLFPSAYRSKIRLIHEGVDTGPARAAARAGHQGFPLRCGRVLQPGEPVITYVARNLEPYRGFHVFMRALPDILRRDPKTQVVVVGGDEVSYGSRPVNFPNWRERMVKEVEIDPDRVHFVGKLPYAQYRSLLHVSAAHVYLTYPFVLSWSMLEAMASECAIVASRTPPVQEVVDDNRHGLLADFFDTRALADGLDRVLGSPSLAARLGAAARARVMANYTVEKGLKQYMELL